MGSFKSLILFAMVCVQWQMIASMTNYEFYQAVKPYIDDENLKYRGIAVADDDDVIYLPGGPNDEFDVEYVLGRMGLLEEISASMTATYSGRTFTLTFALNDHRVFSHAVDLSHIPAICYPVPGLPVAKVCLQLYDLDIRQRKICAKIVGKLNIQVHEFKVDLKLGCVQIPILKNAHSLYLGQAAADDVDIPNDDVTKPADRLMSLFVTELWKSLNDLGY